MSNKASNRFNNGCTVEAIAGGGDVLRNGPRALLATSERKSSWLSRLFAYMSPSPSEAPKGGFQRSLLDICTQLSRNCGPKTVVDLIEMAKKGHFRSVAVVFLEFLGVKEGLENSLENTKEQKGGKGPVRSPRYKK